MTNKLKFKIFRIMKLCAVLILCAINGVWASHSYAQNTPLSLEVYDKEISSLPNITQQTITVTGIVTDTNGETLPGVNISIKGTTTGISSDIDGRYSLNVPGRETVLVFSYIGYNTQETVVGNRQTINVTLIESISALDEVVVIGYGTARKSDVTGAVARADLSALQNSPNVNMVEGLKGAVSGLNITSASSARAGGEPNVTIRGRNSISGSLSPLIVLDGIIYRGNFNDINPSDIESIDILKDASSAAIYGSQAAGGVMLITTKIAKSMSKPVIEYSGNFSLQKIMNTKLHRLNREEYLTQLKHNDIANSRLGPDFLQENPNYDITKNFGIPSSFDGYEKNYDIDWWGLLTEDVPYIQNHNLSLRGRNELTSYYLSFGFMDQKNLIKNDIYKRYNLRVNVDAKIANWISVGTQSFFTSSDLSGDNPAFNAIIRLSALSSPWDSEGNLIPLMDEGSTNPLVIIQYPDEEYRYNLTGNFYTDITLPFVKGLSYRLNYSRNLTINKHFNFNPVSNAHQGSAYKNNNSGYSWTLDHILTYKRDFGKHSVNATAVYGIEKRGYENTNSTANNFTNKTLGYNYFSAAQSDRFVVSTGAWQETSLYMMGRVVYTFNDRYTATATIRRDGFSGFGKDNKFGLFPSAAVAWRVSEENFLKDNVSWIDNLKLRLSYGQNGNRALSRYDTMAKMSTLLTGSGGKGGVGGYLFGDSATPELTQAINTMSNSGLKWETTTSLNIGLDFSVLNGKLSGVYEFYSSNTHNMLYNVNIPTMNGAYTTNIPTNIGKLHNTGHEISITGIPVRTRDFEWTVTVNFWRNRNKVKSILGLDVDGDGREDDIVNSKIFINHPFGVCYDYNIIGMWQIADVANGIVPNGFTWGMYKVEDMDGDGIYSAANDRKILGYTDPSYRFSIQNTLSYKRIELRAVINSVQGGKDYYYGQPLLSLNDPAQLRNYSFFNAFDYWLPENPNAKYRQLGRDMVSAGANVSPYVQRNFIRLQELTLSYNLPASLLKKAGIGRARVYVSGNNMFTITKWDGWDPEANQGVTHAISGYPTMKYYTIGLNFEF